MESEASSWPQSGDKAFSTDGKVQFHLEAWRNGGWDGAYVYGFKDAADALADAAIRRGQALTTDWTMIPMCYLYRHYLELQMKRLLLRSVTLGHATETDDLCKSHSLQKLWQRTKPMLEALWTDGPAEELEAIGEIIGEFEAVDPSGQEFRYEIAKSKDRKAALISLEKMPQRFSVDVLKETIAKVDSFFECAMTAFDMVLDQK